MRHIPLIKLIVCLLLGFFAFEVNAQTVVDNVSDSLLKESADNEELFQLAYRKTTRENLPTGVSVIDMKELIKKNYNTYTLDNLQGYVGGWNGNSLWAMDEYLVLVDGVPRDVNNVLPSEIENITFLKSASAVVLYGSRAAKGVILINTKRGKASDLEIDVRVNTGYDVSKSYPKYLGSAEYMTLYNEARVNDGLSPLYSDEEIYLYGSGTNPYRYPDVDFYSSDYLKKAYNRSDVTAEISGGNNRARYYTNIGYYRSEDIFKFGQAKNNYVSRFNVRGNIDLNLNDYISAFVNANATYYDSRSTNATNTDYWTNAASMRPNRVSPLIPLDFIEEGDINSWMLINNSLNVIDGKYFLGGSQIDQTNIFADYYAGGHSKWTSRQFQFDTGINFDLARVLRGLSFHTQFAVDYATSYNISYNNEYAVFAPSWTDYNGEDKVGSLTKYNNDKKSGVQNISGSSDRQTIAFNGYFQYENSIDNTHNFSALFAAAGYQQTQSEVYHRTASANLGLQINYNYLERYYVDFGSALIHSARLAENHRAGFSPSLTLGWRLGKEAFLTDSPVVDDLMLTLSGSVLNTDLDISDYYMYSANYTQAEGAWWGWFDGASEHSTNSLRGANENLTFIKRKELALGLRTSLWNEKVTADANVFVNSMEGLIIEPSTLFPSYFFTYWPDASFIPYVNYNNNRRIGMDFAINLKERIGRADFILGVSGTYYDTEATRRDENYEYAYQNRAGRPIDGVWGLESDGFFESEEEIQNSPEQKFGGTLKPGDLKYVDQNNDNVIDDKDVVFLGKGGWYGSPFTLGINLTAKWNNFTLFGLCTGGFGGHAMKNSSYYWVYGDNKYSEIVRGRWTEVTKDNATYPRLTTTSGTNNFRDSDFWIYSTDRLNLAKIQLTYDFPRYMLRNGLVKELSAYVSGSNLATIAKERRILELNTTSTPQARFYNVGVKVVF